MQYIDFSYIEKVLNCSAGVGFSGAQCLESLHLVTHKIRTDLASCGLGFRGRLPPFKNIKLGFVFMALQQAQQTVRPSTLGSSINRKEAVQRHVDSVCVHICSKVWLLIYIIYIDTTMVYTNACCDQCGNMLLRVQREPRPLNPHSLQSLALYSACHDRPRHIKPSNQA